MVRRPEILVSVLLCLACTPAKEDNSAPQDATPAKQESRVDQERLTKLLASPTSFIRDIRKSEKTAMVVAKDALKPLCADLKKGEAPTGNLSDSFVGLWFSNMPEKPKRRTVEYHDLSVASQPLERVKFAEEIERFSQRFSDLRRCKLGLSKFKLMSEVEAWGTLNVVIAGVSRELFQVSLHGYPRVRFKKIGDKWKLDAWGGDAFALQSSKLPLFVEVSRWIGADLRRSTDFASVLQKQLDSRQIETIGGLAVVDLNKDFRHDFIAWNHRRTLQVFINDGIAGFDRIVDPIPRKAVGLHHLVLDLDGDGHPELVSTEITECKRGVAEFPVFSIRGKTFRRRPGMLKFNRECNGLDQVKFQHIAVADINDDGHFDLFFSGFSHRFSKSHGHNGFRSNRGEPNRLFISQGKGKFKEDAEARGVAGSSFSYGAVFFDYGKDGNTDLYVVNDYGTNVLYKNDGGGFFQATKSSLSENGQSMGVTEADINEDGLLDLYVSNMYSKAGNRIVPLAQKSLKKETYEELMTVAQGNTAYIQNDDHSFTERGQELGIAKAGWAWGHTFFDSDLDGIKELLVVNGNVTHSDAQAPDY